MAADSATQSITILASPERCFEIATDFERYPEWAHDVKEATVHAVDDHGRATEVEFRAAALGFTTHYTLGYEYADNPTRMSWQLLKGDITKAIDGAYTFAPSPAGGTDVTYDLTIELVVPLPGFVKRRAEVRILRTLRELKARVEELSPSAT